MSAAQDPFRARLAVTLLCVLFSPALAQTGKPPAASAAPRSIPATLGWHEIPSTRLRDACPPSTPQYNFAFQCQNVIAAWGGGIFDEARNRLILWGGGHTDYSGNELYALDLSSLALVRLNDPSPVNPDPGRCSETLPDGKPNSRHTYNGLAYIASAHRMFAWGGSLACPGGWGTHATWTLDLDTLKWELVDPGVATNDRSSGFGAMAAYDPNTRLVFLHTTDAFYSYDVAANRYRRLNSSATSIHMTGVIDPKRRLFVMMGGQSEAGGGIRVIRIQPGSSFSIEDWTAKAKDCSALAQANCPGLAYDPVQDLIVGWAGGDSVYLFSPDTKSCTKVTYPSGPGAPPAAGTNGRWRYVPALGVFVVVNGWDENAFALRLTSPPR